MFGWITAKASARGLAIAAVCMAAIIVCFSPDIGLYWKLVGYEGVPELLDMEMLRFYGPEHARELLAANADGREAQYSGFYVLDLLFPIAYYFVFSYAVALLYRSPQKRMTPWLLVPPLVIALCDLSENALFVTMVFLPGARVTPVAETASILTQVKFAAMLITVLLIVSGLAVLLWRRFGPESRSA